MKWKFGLQARFFLVVGVTFALILLLLILVGSRQSQMQKQAEQQGLEALHRMGEDMLRQRGETSVNHLAELLTNPVYYFDLEEIGRLIEGARSQPDVVYVLVYDAEGRVVHDGSAAINAYGQGMSDPFAAEVIAATSVSSQWSSNVLDVSAPILIGGQRFGGVRVGYSLEGIRKYEDETRKSLSARLQDLGRRHFGWMLILLATMGAATLLTAWLLRRHLVQPIQRLAKIAGDIESGRYDIERPESQRRDEVGELIRAFSRMSDGISAHDREIRRMAYSDTLTGLNNRLGFRENLNKRLQSLDGKGGQLALVFADVDDFKRINDTMGHEAGDEAIRQYALRIGRVMERFSVADPLLARFGGDEFVILLQAEDVRDVVQQIAEDLIDEFRFPIHLHGRHVFLGTSIGISLFPQDATDAIELMKCGDIAMYQAKQAGKNCYRFYSKAMEEEAGQRRFIEEDLRGAWDRGELRVLYQPIYMTDSGVLAGAEALLRWNHPVHGQVPTESFIAVAERSGIITELGPRVLAQACRTAAQWVPKEGCPAPFVSVNLSPRQLGDRAFVAQVEESLQSAGLPASRLHLELTETALLRDEALSTGVLARLHEMGLQIWLDDFGTGFSGLSHLRRVPVDGLKIDRSFVADLEHDEDDRALTAAIIAMAHSLNIKAVAEGVETEEQLKLLREHGCDLAQGYWLGYPMTAENFKKLLD